MCIAGVWNLQATSFEIPWFLGDIPPGKDWWPPKLIPSEAKLLAAASSSKPIEIEDVETGEIHHHGGEKDTPPAEEGYTAGDKAADYVDPISPQLLQRNKGWKRVASLAAKIAEKKQKGEWMGPDVPIPSTFRHSWKNNTGSTWRTTRTRNEQPNENGNIGCWDWPG